jgi:hypothetical protein
MVQVGPSLGDLIKRSGGGNSFLDVTHSTSNANFPPPKFQAAIFSFIGTT